MLVCYDGDTARVATSVLRARNIQASSIKGGMLGHDFGSILVSLKNKEKTKYHSAHQNMRGQDVNVSISMPENAAMDRGASISAIV